MDQATARAYLERFGYPSTSNFQAAAGLVPDGYLGPITMRAMEMPRCGVSDLASPASAGSGARDPGRDYQADPIIYHHRGWVSGLDEVQQRIEFAAAFASWSEVCGVAGRPALPGETAELVIDVRTRRNDRYLDGPGRTLAYAIIGGGLIVFDGDETWRASGSTAPGILFRNVAAHELGHTLNFYHSRVSDALLAPIYSRAVPAPVSPDDIERGQRAYGQPFATTTTPAPTTPPPGPPANDLFTGTLKYKNGRLVGWR